MNFGDLPCCHWSAYTLSLVCLYVVTGLPTCCHWSAYMFSHPHPQCSFVVFCKRSKKCPIQRLDSVSCVWRKCDYDHSSFPSHISCSQILCVGHVAVEYEHNSLLLRWFNKVYEMSQPSNKPLIEHPAFANGGPPFASSILILFRLYVTFGTKFM